MLNNSFLQNLIGLGKGSIRELFSRSGKKVDGDFAQLASINSQFGITKFDEDEYSIQVSASTNDSPVRLFADRNNPLIGVFFSADTENLQETDYVSPGKIVFRTNPLLPNCKDATYKYGFQSQTVPFYQWKIDNSMVPTTIFGSQKNEWLTSKDKILQYEYQNLDRSDSYYFKSENTGSDFYKKNYIWNVDSNGQFNVDSFPAMRTEILVGAPNHFYFGLKLGKTAIDRYFTEYLNIELNDSRK
jgi:hypothetical protein